MLDKDSTKNMKINRREKAFAYGLLFALALLSVASVSLFSRLQARYSISQFLPVNHPLLIADSETRQRFFIEEAQPILVTLSVTNGDWLETGRLSRLGTITKNIATMQGASGALSIGNVPSASQNKDEVAIGSMLDITYAERLKRVKSDRSLNPLLISENGQRALLIIRMRDNDVSAEEMKKLVADVRESLMNSFPEATISAGGVPAIQMQLAALVKTELVHFMGFALLACCLTLFAVFSSKRSVTVPFVAILATNIFVLAFMAVAGISMTVLASTIPILVSVTVLSLCIHTMLRFVEDSHKHVANPESKLSNKAQVVFETLKSLALPNLLTALTTCFGFATLIIEDVPVIHDFGVAVAVSVMISWVMSSLVLAPLLLLAPIPVVRGWVLREATWASFIIKKSRAIVVVVLVGCIASALVGQNLHWTAKLFDDLPKHEEARIATDEIDSVLGGTIPFEVVVDKNAEGQPWNDPQAIRRIDEVLKFARTLPEVGSAIGLPDLLRMALGNPNAEIPAERKTIAENWFVISMSEDSPLKSYLTGDGGSTRLSMRMRDVAGDKLEATMATIEARAKAAFPDAKVTTAGMATTVHRLNNGLSRSLMTGFWEALGVITLLLALVFRSWRWTLVAVLPNLVPAAILIGVLALAQTPIKPSVALVFSIALGIAFNNTVYLLQRLKSLMEKSGKSAAEEIERTLRLEGNPCLVASLCLLSGFGIFLMSEFGINRTFGMYMLVSLFFGLVGDLAFMPALVRMCPWILVSTRKLESDNLIKPTLTLIPEEKMRVVPALHLITNDAAPTAVAAQAVAVDESSSAPARAAAAAVLALLTAFAPVQKARAATQDANVILKNVEKTLDSKDEREMIKMKVVESNGSSKERDVEIMRKSGAKNQVLVRLKAPSDVSGVALLSVSQGGSEDQWLYMPSQKKARRVVSGNKNQKFLDTEFSLEDFSAGTYARFENKIVKEERAPSAAIAVIESKSKVADSSYSRIMTWVDLNSFQVQKSEYYDKGGKLLKTMVFRDYKKFGTAWRAQTIEVRNMQTQRSTLLHMANLKLNSGLSDREFTQSALEQED